MAGKIQISLELLDGGFVFDEYLLDCIKETAVAVRYHHLCCCIDDKCAFNILDENKECLRCVDWFPLASGLSMKYKC